MPSFPINVMENTASRHFGANPVISPNLSTVHPLSQTNQNLPEMSEPDKPGLDENDLAVIFSKSIPTLFELMPTNPKFWTLPARLQNTSYDQLAFPYDQLAKGIIPEIKDVPPIESFKYFSISYDKHLNSVVENLTDLHDVLMNLPLTATWFPANNYADANWYSLEGYQFVDGFVLEDLQ